MVRRSVESRARGVNRAWHRLSGVKSWRPLLLFLAALAGVLWALRPGTPAAPASPDAESPRAASLPDAGAGGTDASAPLEAGPDGGNLRPFCTSPGDNPMSRLPDPLPSYVREELQRFPDLARQLAREDAALQGFLSRLLTTDSADAESPPPSPRRRIGGVDLYGRALAVRARSLLGRGESELPRALAFADRSVAVDESDPVTRVLRALVRERLGQRADALSDLRRAFELEPLHPRIALGLARRLERSGDSAEALAALTTYRALASPAPTPSEDDAAGRFQAQLERQMALTRSHVRVAVRGVSLLYPEPSLSRSDAEALATGIADALDETARLTSTTRRPELTVVAYATCADLLSVACVPLWAAAYFDGIVRLHLEGSKPDLQGSYRHEAVHAQLSSAVRNAPLWFHEGLADSVSRPGSFPARRHGKLALLARNRTWIPFSSLNDSLSSFDDPDSGIAYAQSDAMVQFLLAEGGPDAVARAVRYLDRGGDPTRLLASTLGRAVEEREVLDFVEKTLGASPALK
ncbi:MAG: tetratricopeptide repeat protein [Myxococcales bacterium]